VNFPLMSRKARKAISAGHYEEAALLYTELMSHEEMADNIDIKIRHAFCVEKAGYSNQAIKLYREISAYYQKTGEVSARESIKRMLEQLENEEKEKLVKVEHRKAEQDKIRIAEEKAKLEAIAKEKARIEKEKRKAIQGEIDQIRARKAEEESIRRDKLQQERLLEEKARKESLRKAKLVAERTRQERHKVKKDKNSQATEYEFLSAVDLDGFDWTDMEEDDGIIVLDLSDTEEAQKEKAYFENMKKNNPTWI